MLLDADENLIHVRDNEGRNPVMLAVERLVHNNNKSIAVLTTLLTRGGDARMKDANGSTSLHILYRGYKDIPTCSYMYMENEDTHVIRAAKLLIQHGADVNATDGHGLTVLHYASKLHSFRILEHLGADIFVRDLQDRSMFAYAVFPALAKYLCEERGLVPTPRDIMFALENSRHRVFKYLITKVNYIVEPVLMRCLCWHKYDLVDHLLGEGLLLPSHEDWIRQVIQSRETTHGSGYEKKFVTFLIKKGYRSLLLLF